MNKIALKISNNSLKSAIAGNQKKAPGSGAMV